MRIILETPRLLLRELTLEDAEDAFRMYGDIRVMRYISGTTMPDVETVREGLVKQIERHESTGWCLWPAVDKVTGRMIGRCGLKPLDDGPEIEVGYHLMPEAWGNGYATEAARACVAYGFEQRGLERIVGVTFPENEASRRVLLKTGLFYEGRRVYYGREVDYFALRRASESRAPEAHSSTD